MWLLGQREEMEAHKNIVPAQLGKKVRLILCKLGLYVSLYNFSPLPGIILI